MSDDIDSCIFVLQRQKDKCVKDFSTIKEDERLRESENREPSLWNYRRMYELLRDIETIDTSIRMIVDKLEN